MSTKQDSILQLYARSPAPCRDYFGLSVSSDNIILNIWNITHGPHIYPKRYKIPTEELPKVKHIQGEIQRIFGDHVLEYVLKLSRNELNLQFVPSRVFHFILRHLAANDILKLSQTSKIFFELCNTNIVWKILYTKRIKRQPSWDDLTQVDDKNWKDILRDKLFRRGPITSGNKMAQKPPPSKIQGILKNKTGDVSVKPAENKNKRNTYSKIHSVNPNANGASKPTSIKTVTANVSNLSRLQPTKVPPVPKIIKSVSSHLEESKSNFSTSALFEPNKNSIRDIKMTALNNMGISTDTMKYLEAKAKAETILEATFSNAAKYCFPKYLTRSDIPPIKNYEKDDSTNKESATNLELSPSKNNVTIRSKFGSTKSAASLPPENNVDKEVSDGKPKHKFSRTSKTTESKYNIPKCMEANSILAKVPKMKSSKDLAEKGSARKPLAVSKSTIQSQVDFDDLIRNKFFDKKVISKTVQMSKA